MPIVHVPAVPQLLEVGIVAHRLSCSPELVRRLIRTRKLAAVRFGRRWRVRDDVLVAYIKAHEWASVDEAPEILRGRDGPRELHNRGA